MTGPTCSTRHEVWPVIRRPILVLTCALTTAAAPAAPPDDAVNFNRDVRPSLADSCFACHGPDASQRKAKLRLDERASAVAKEAIVPGKPGESELIARVTAANESERMP